MRPGRSVAETQRRRTSQYCLRRLHRSLRFPSRSRLEISNESEACLIGSSSCGDSEGLADEKVCPSHFRCGDCSEMLHELSNVMTGVLTNAQLLGWKLPPYSHLKRSVREVERGAQRSGELLRRLKERCTAQP